MDIFDEPKIDCHLHVFDPDRFPYQTDSFYKPVGQEKATPVQLDYLMDAYGVRNALLVEPNSGYNEDNRCLLDTIARSHGRLKGIAVVANNASWSELEDLSAQGVVGIAMNPALYGTAEYAGADRLLERLAGLDLLAQVQVQGDQLLELLPMLKDSGAKLLIDHCGRPNIEAGIGQPGFQALLELGHCGKSCVKLSGYSKFSRKPFPYEDTWPYLTALAEAFSLDACVWASDWPFLRASERIDYGVLLGLIDRLFPDREDRSRLLWHSPRSWFGFESDLEERCDR